MAETTDFSLLGTVVRVKVDTGRLRSSRRIAQGVIDQIRALERIFNLFDPSSEISSLRRTGQTDSAELRDVLAQAHSWHRETDGLFNPVTSQPAVLPWPATGAETTGETSYADLDLNAIAKGWIIQRAADSCRHYRRLTIDAGGDILHRGHPSLEVGIENPALPYDNAPPLGRVMLDNTSIATSGPARRGPHLRHQEEIPEHAGVISASVVHESASAADALATALASASIDQAIELSERLQLDALLVRSDGSSTLIGSGFELY